MTLKFIFVYLLNITIYSNGFNNNIMWMKSFGRKIQLKSLNDVTGNVGHKIIAPKFEESCENTGITLTRYMIEAVAANPEIRELESVRYIY